MTFRSQAVEALANRDIEEREGLVRPRVSSDLSQGTGPAVHTWTHDVLGNGAASRILLDGPGNDFEAAVASTWGDHQAGRDTGTPVASNSQIQVLCRRVATEELSAPNIRLTGGRPLPTDQKARFGSTFGHDFSDVRVHTDSTASTAAAELNAKAFAMGAHLFFGEGEFQPGSPEGDRLIAHELTHVVQHHEGRLPSGGGVSSPSDPTEREAYANEGAILRDLPSSGAQTDTSDHSDSSSARSSSSASTTSLRAMRADDGTTDTADSDTSTGETTEGETEEGGNQELIDKCRNAASSPEAATVLAEVCNTDNVQETVKELDEDGALTVLLETLGASAWDDTESADNLLKVLQWRTAEDNHVTLMSHMGLVDQPKDIETAQAEQIYQILKALPENLRSDLLGTEDGEYAFGLMDSCSAVSLRLEAGFGFYDSDYSALLKELEAIDNWNPDRLPHLRSVFWMLIQAGYAEHETVQTYVDHNWEYGSDFFSELGYSKKGEFTLEAARQVEDPRKVKMKLGPLVKSVKGSRGQAAHVIGHYFFDRIGKKSTIDGLDAALFAEGLSGGHIGGIIFEMTEAGDGEGEISVSMDEKAGHLEIGADDLAIAAISMPITSEGEAYTVTASGGQLTGFSMVGDWADEGGAADQLTIKFAGFSLRDLTIAAGETTMSVATIDVTGLELSGDLTIASADNPRAFSELIDTTFDAVMQAVDVLYLAYCTVMNAVALATGGPVDSDVQTQLSDILKQKYDEELNVTIKWEGLKLQGLVFNDGKAIDEVECGPMTLAVTADTRTSANMEVLRLISIAESEERGFTTEEIDRISALAEILSGPAMPAIDEALLGELGLSVSMLTLDLSVEQAVADSPDAQTSALRIVIPAEDGEGEVHQETILVDDAFSVQLQIAAPTADQEGTVITVFGDVPQVHMPDGYELSDMGGLGAVTLDGLKGTVAVTESGDIVLTGVELGTLVVGETMYLGSGFTLRTKGETTANDVRVDMTIHRMTGVEELDGTINSLSISSLGASEIAFHSSAFELTLTGGSLSGISLQNLDLGDKTLDGLVITESVLTGLDGSVKGSAFSGSDVSVQTLVVTGGDVGSYHFTTEDLTAGTLESAEGIAFLNLNAESSSGDVTVGEDEEGNATIDADVNVEDLDGVIMVGDTPIRVTNADIKLTVSGETASFYTTIPGLNAGPVAIADNDLNVTVATLTANAFTAAIHFDLTGGMLQSVLIQKIEIPSAEMTGFSLEVPSKSVKISQPEGTTFKLVPLSVDGLKIVPGEGSYLSWLEEGGATIGQIEVGQIQADGPNAIMATMTAMTGAVDIGFNDGTMTYTVNDITLDGEGGAKLGEGDSAFAVNGVTGSTSGSISDDEMSGDFNVNIGTVSAPTIDWLGDSGSLRAVEGSGASLSSVTVTGSWSKQGEEDAVIILSEGGVGAISGDVTLFLREDDELAMTEINLGAGDSGVVVGSIAIERPMTIVGTDLVDGQFRVKDIETSVDTDKGVKVMGLETPLAQMFAASGQMHANELWVDVSTNDEGTTETRAGLLGVKATNMSLDTTTSSGDLNVKMPSAEFSMWASNINDGVTSYSSAEFSSIKLTSNANLTLTPVEEIVPNLLEEEVDPSLGPIPSSFDPLWLSMATGDLYLEIIGGGFDHSVRVPISQFVRRTEGESTIFTTTITAKSTVDLDIDITFTPDGHVTINIPSLWDANVVDTRDESEASDSGPIRKGWIGLTIPSPITVAEGTTVQVDRIYSDFFLEVNEESSCNKLAITGLHIVKVGDDGSTTEVSLGMDAHMAWSSAVPDADVDYDGAETGATLHATLHSGTEIIGLNMSHTAAVSLGECEQPDE